VESRDRVEFVAIHVAQAAMLIGLAAGVAWIAGAIRRRRRSVMRLAARLDAAAPLGTLEAALSRAVDDPDLRMAYWLPQSHRFVDAAGSSVEPVPEAGGTSITLQRGDEIVAVVLTRAGLDERRLLETVGAAARLTIDNERLQAELAAQLAELTASRVRIIAAADGTRRRVERDLHDSAQAALVAAMFHLALARADLPDSDAGKLAEEASAVAARLRALTHGVYPVTLDQFGLDAALRSLIDDGPAGTELRLALTSRHEPAIERAAYAVVAAAIGSSRPLRIFAADEGGRLTVRIDGFTPSEVDVEHLEDRVGAIGGTLGVEGSVLDARFEAP
jgi:signal transduction histidine kinase